MTGTIRSKTAVVPFDASRSAPRSSADSGMPP